MRVSAFALYIKAFKFEASKYGGGDYCSLCFKNKSF